jgi:signal peptidase
MKKLKSIGRILYWVLLLALFFVAGLTAVSALNIPGNYKMMVVLSGSMEPAIKTGSVVVVKPADSYNKGEVISFNDPRSGKTSVTHRIFEIKETEEGKAFVTKGDANDAPDMNEIKQGQIMGKTLFSLPYIGYPISFAKTQTGLIVMIIIPAVIIIYSELISIKNEAVRLIAERKKRKLTVLEKAEVVVGEEIMAVENEVKEIEEEVIEAIKPAKKTKKKNEKKTA